MIEHISYGAGLIMLRECFRVLKPNGILRLVTPDMKFLISLFYEATSNQRYIEWASERFIKDNAPSCATSVINHFHHAWGHRYIYDGSVIKDALEKAGFSEITECQISKSDHPELSNLENIQRMPPGFLEMESIIFEAQKICR
jgi:predicted SAM-dependent methyltransferase